MRGYADAALALIGGMLLLSGCGGAPERAAQTCYDMLQSERIVFTPATLPDTGCSVETPVRVSKADIDWSPPATMACGFASRLREFIHETAEPLARADLGDNIRAMRNMGAFSCRRIASRDRMSEHASGLAIDIAGFELGSGGYVSVEHDWHGGNAKARFLHDFARAACKRFSVVLTPDYNRDHRNHIHIDAGPQRLCGERAGESPPDREARAE